MTVSGAISPPVGAPASSASTDSVGRESSTGSGGTPAGSQPLVQSVRSYLAEEPKKTEPAILLKRHDLNNNPNRLSARKNVEEKEDNSPPRPVGVNEMPSAAERMQRQPLLPRNKQHDSRISLRHDDCDADQEEPQRPSQSVNQTPNGDFHIEIPDRGERFPKEIWKTVLSFLFLSLCVIINMVSLSLVHERLPDRDKYPPLPDVFLDNVAPIEWALTASEILIMLSTSAATAIMIFHKHRFIVLRRVFFLVGLLYFYRSITMYVTVLPISTTTYYCSPKLNHTTPLIIIKRVVGLISGFGLAINGKHTYCGDSIYSGHTMILVLSYLIIAEYSPRRVLALHWAAGLAAVAGVLLLLLGHAHYVIDVIIAYYITTRLFWGYHTLTSRQLRQGSPTMISREWWMVIFNYFEKNVDGPVPRQYNWPLPWPKAKLFSQLS